MAVWPARYPIRNLRLNWLLAVAGLVTFVIIFCCGWIKRKEYTSEQQQNIKILIICILLPAVLALLAGSSPGAQTHVALERASLYLAPLLHACGDCVQQNQIPCGPDTHGCYY